MTAAVLISTKTLRRKRKKRTLKWSAETNYGMTSWVDSAFFGKKWWKFTKLDLKFKDFLFYVMNHFFHWISNKTQRNILCFANCWRKLLKVIKSCWKVGKMFVNFKKTINFLRKTKFFTDWIQKIMSRKNDGFVES